jgi:hypothetical protein
MEITQIAAEALKLFFKDKETDLHFEVVNG